MPTYIWRFSVALVRIFECVWLIKFIIALVYIQLKHIHGNSYDTPVSILLLNMIFLVSFLFITKLVLCLCSVSHTKFFYMNTCAHVPVHILRTYVLNKRVRVYAETRFFFLPRTIALWWEHSLEFQFFLQAVPAEKWGCIGNYPLLHLTVTIEVRSCPVSMVQVCCPTQTAHSPRSHTLE